MNGSFLTERENVRGVCVCVIVEIASRLPWSPVEFIWDELEIEATDPSQAQLLQPYLRKSPKNYQWTFLSNRSIGRLHISEAVIHAKGSCLDEGND